MIGTWTGSGEMAGFGKFDDEYQIEWTHGGNFIKNSYWMRSGGKEVWHDTGMIGWDADKKKFVGINFGFDGTIGWGEGGVADDKTTLTFEGETVGPNENLKFRASMKKGEGDTMIVICEMKDGDKWKAYGPERTLQRKKK